MIAQSSLTPAAPIAAAIFLVAMALVIARPWRLTEASAALIGAGAMVLAGLASPGVAVSDSPAIRTPTTKKRPRTWPCGRSDSRLYPAPGWYASSPRVARSKIIAAAQRLHSDAVILCARPRTGPTELGPRSVGHLARFVVDHSPVPVLLIRRSS